MADTAPAWQVRDIQRQKFVGKMVRMVQEAEEDGQQEGNEFFLEDVVTTLFFTLARRRHAPRKLYEDFFRRLSISV